MTTFFGQTFSNVTHLDVSQCGLYSQAVEVHLLTTLSDRDCTKGCKRMYYSEVCYQVLRKLYPNTKFVLLLNYRIVSVHLPLLSLPHFLITHHYIMLLISHHTCCHSLENLSIVAHNPI